MRFRTAALVAAPAITALSLTAGPALAQNSTTLTANLDEQNNSGASGHATLSLHGNRLTVDISAHGLVPKAPHAQHIHGSTSGKMFHCPDKGADKNGDGVVSTAEGLPDYGDILISLTTKGDTSKQSGLAVDRFPVADGNGNVRYHRTLTVSDSVVRHLKDLHVVQHGIDTNDNGTYDFNKGKSELDPKLPQEATAPADCGMIDSTPNGGVAAGGGTSEVTTSPALLGLGAASLLGAAGLTVAVRRRRSES